MRNSIKNDFVIEQIRVKKKSRNSLNVYRQYYIQNIYRQYNNKIFSYTILCNVHVFMFTQKQLIDKTK